MRTHSSPDAERILSSLRERIEKLGDADRAFGEDAASARARHLEAVANVLDECSRGLRETALTLRGADPADAAVSLDTIRALCGRDTVLAARALAIARRANEHCAAGGDFWQGALVALAASIGEAEPRG